MTNNAEQCKFETFYSTAPYIHILKIIDLIYSMLRQRVHIFINLRVAIVIIWTILRKKIMKLIGKGLIRKSTYTITGFSKENQ